MFAQPVASSACCTRSCSRSQINRVQGTGLQVCVLQPCACASYENAVAVVTQPQTRFRVLGRRSRVVQAAGLPRPREVGRAHQSCRCRSLSCVGLTPFHADVQVAGKRVKLRHKAPGVAAAAGVAALRGVADKEQTAHTPKMNGDIFSVCARLSRANVCQCAVWLDGPGGRDRRCRDAPQYYFILATQMLCCRWLAPSTAPLSPCSSAHPSPQASPSATSTAVYPTDPNTRQRPPFPSPSHDTTKSYAVAFKCSKHAAAHAASLMPCLTQAKGDLPLELRHSPAPCRHESGS